MSDELKPCPFCGGEATPIVGQQPNSGDLSYSVACVQCNTAIFRANTKAWNPYKSIKEAVDAWNWRVENE